MLAPVSGTEKVCSVGTGHAAAFCRAANAGCKTPHKLLQNTDGGISIQKLKRNPNFKIMLEEGWFLLSFPRGLKTRGLDPQRSCSER